MIGALAIRLSLWGGAAASLARLVKLGFPAWRAGTLAALFGQSATQREVFAVLRGLWPNLAVSRRLITSYDNTGTVVVTRHADVTEVLEREADFAVVYEPKMRAITDGENFFLGMQDSPAYTRDVSAMRLAVRREDVATRIVPFVAAEAERIVAGAPGRIDVAADLTRRIPARILGAYFATPGPSEDEMIGWTTQMFWYLFADLKGEASVSVPALAAAAACRAYLDATIAHRKSHPGGEDDVLARCLALQAAGVPGMDDVGIRNNLIGLMIGLVPTLSKAAVHALAQLLDRPDALAGAQAAARADDDARLAAHVFEALRFDPVNPVVYRRALRESVIARGSFRSVRVREGAMVLAANLSAMFDPLAVEEPDRFRTDRPWRTYMLWGYGMHTCFGAEINHAVIPQMLKPLLKHPGLARAAGAEGQVDGRGTPFPASFTVTFNA